MYISDDLVSVLISRSGNRFTVNDSLKMISFYIAKPLSVEFYFVDPNRLGKGFTLVEIGQSDIADLIKIKDKVLRGGHTVQVPKFYW